MRRTPTVPAGPPGTRVREVCVLILGPLLAAVPLLWGPVGPGTDLHALWTLLFPAAGAGVVIGTLLDRRMRRRLHALRLAAEASEGDPGGVPLPAAGSDEFSRFAAALNRLFAQTRKSRAHLERLIGENTELVELQRSVLDNAAEYAILSDDLSGKILWANRGAALTFGLSCPSEMAGRSFTDFLAPEEVASGKYLDLLRCTGEDRTWSAAIRCQRMKGDLFPAHLRVAPRRGRSGEVAGRVLVLRDTSREESAENRYRDLFQELQEAVYLTARDGTFLDANEAMARLLGFSSPADLFARPATEFYADAADRDLWLEELERTGTLRDHEVRIRRRDGQVRVCIETSRTLRGQERGSDCYLGTLIDVTERFRLQQRLIQTQRIEAVGMLASGLAHDFNNILSAIVPNAELIEKCDEAPDAVRDRARTIRAAAARAGDITRQLLSFAKREYGSSNAVDLNQVVQESTRLLAPSLPEGVQLETRLQPGSPTVFGDATALQQVIVNLVLNARDAVGPEGRIVVSTRHFVADEKFCRGRDEMRPGRYGLVSVKDDGAGMRPEQLEFVFDPFYTTKESGVGTGLGLSVVYGIVSRFRGHVGIRSTPGKGSRFDVYLPEATSRAKTATRARIPVGEPER